MYRSLRAGLASSLLLTTVVVAPAARAQGAGDKAAAEAVFEQAQALVADKKFDEACKKFELSQQLDAGVGTLLYLADCYQQAGRFASAWATFKEAAAAARAAGQTDRESMARGLADALEPKLSKLTILVPKESAIDGLEIRRDGELIARGLWSVPIPVDAGTRCIEAVAPGRKAWSTSFQINGPGDSQVAVPALESLPAPALAAAPVAPGPLPPPAMAPASAALPDRATSGGGTQRAVGYVVGGVGVVGLGVATMFALNAKSKNSDAGTYCGPDGFCSAQGVALGGQAKDAANLATYLSVGGLVALSGGLLLILLTAPSGSSSVSSSGLHVAADVGPRGAAFGVRSRW